MFKGLGRIKFGHKITIFFANVKSVTVFSPLATPKTRSVYLYLVKTCFKSVAIRLYTAPFVWDFVFRNCDGMGVHKRRPTILAGT